MFVFCNDDGDSRTFGGGGASSQRGDERVRRLADGGRRDDDGFPVRWFVSDVGLPALISSLVDMVSFCLWLFLPLGLRV